MIGFRIFMDYIRCYSCVLDEFRIWFYLLNIVIINCRSDYFQNGSFVYMIILALLKKINTEFLDIKTYYEDI